MPGDRHQVHRDRNVCRQRGDGAVAQVVPAKVMDFGAFERANESTVNHFMGGREDALALARQALQDLNGLGGKRHVTYARVLGEGLQLATDLIEHPAHAHRACSQVQVHPLEPQQFGTTQRSFSGKLCSGQNVAVLATCELGPQALGFLRHEDPVALIVEAGAASKR